MEAQGVIVEQEGVQAAVSALAQGRPVLLYDADGREKETDIVWSSSRVTPEAVRTMRTDGGGLICTTLAPSVHAKLGLPYLEDVLLKAASAHPMLARLANGHVPYESDDNQKPSFGLSINHRETFTGVTDNDRSMTIRRLAEFAERAGQESDEELRDAFADQFKAPGHVMLLNAHERLLDGRRGHTELATALVEMAGLGGSATICEMMNGPSGRALPKPDAIKYAASNGLVFLTGDEVIQAWRKAQASPKTT